MQDTLTDEGADTFWFLTNWEFDYGLIGLHEYEERYEVLHWLLGNEPSDGGQAGNDPRGNLERTADSLRSEEQSENAKPHAAHEEATGAESQKTGSGSPSPDENLPLQLIPPELRNRWCFTKNDADSYPSVPHGHLNDKTNAWPKLNPYLGRAFAAKHREDTRYRLHRSEMIKLWNSPNFRAHALETIVWYQAAHPHHRFLVRNPRRLPRKRRQ
ncbi:hypothetical protein [Corallococcus coralloides]|uniref:hypothetical protein n=1 Tax=Corallococcus coralloides TaxID=184914 RepID=UPI0011D26FFC|nr:hypothetical protein [Corallococcus coralloides]